MAVEFLMPKLGLTMEEGTILQWLVEDGAIVSPGTPVMLIETDKVESEVECSGSGRLHRIGAEGDAFPCGAVVGLLLADGETAPAADAPIPAATAPGAAAGIAVAGAGSNGATNGHAAAEGRRFVSPNARRLAAERGIDLTARRGTGPGGRIVSEDLDDVAPTRVSAPVRIAPAASPRQAVVASAADEAMVPATVAARQLADLLGVDLALVPPDPVDGYVTREAVARYVRARLQPPPSAPASGAVGVPTGTPTTQIPTRVRRLTGMRGTIAKRMHQSLQEMAQLTLTMDADMDAVVADRDARKSAGDVPAYTDYVIAAVAAALREHPRINAQLTAEGIAELPGIHIGLAVALDEGLVVPVVRNADRLGLTDIAAVTRRLAASARAGTLALADLEGGTFSVSALGMFGVDAFTPVINPPNVAILGVGRVRDELGLVDGAVHTRKRLTLSLTWDHRVLDGAPAAAFCASIVAGLAAPDGLQQCQPADGAQLRA